MTPRMRDEAAVFFRAFLGFARWRAAGAAALIGLGAAFEGLGLLLLVPVLDVVTGASAGGGRAAALLGRLRLGGPTEQLLILLGLFALLMTIRSLVLARRDRAIDRLQLEFVESVRLRLVGRLAAAPWQSVAQISHARVAQALSLEIHQIGIAANSALLAVVSLIMLAGYCVLALWLAPLAGAVAIASAALAGLISWPYLARARGLGRAITEAHFDMTGGAMAFLGGLKVAAAEGLQDRFVDSYRAASSAAMRDRLSFTWLQTGLRNTTTVVAAMIGAASLFLGVTVFHLSPAVLITLLLVLSRMSAPALNMQQSAQHVLHSLPAYGVVLALESELARAAPSPVAGRGAEVGAKAPIVLRNVTFAHDPSRPAELRNINLLVPPGAFVGIAGPSGTGKTTFLDLVAGILTPQAGTVSGPRAERLAYVAQDPFLFDDTIRRNLAWSGPERSEAEMLAALDLVGAGALMARLDRGLDSRVGERGVLISAGERQRLALARAVLRAPAVLALDEATNALDIASERAILERLAAMRARPTILMIAHRAESLALCDHRLTFPGAMLSRIPEAGLRKSS